MPSCALSAFETLFCLRTLMARRYNEELQYLSLQHCGVGDVGGALLAYGIRRNQTLVYLNAAHNALGMIGGRSLLRVKRSKMELLQGKQQREVFVAEDPFLPKPVAAVPASDVVREFQLVGVVPVPRMPVGFVKGDVVIDISRCSIDFIGAITPDVLNMQNPNGAYELDLANIRDRCGCCCSRAAALSSTHLPSGRLRASCGSSRCGSRGRIGWGNKSTASR